MLEKLMSDHDEIEVISDELLARVRMAVLDDPSGLSKCRWRLQRVLSRHLALEDKHVYARLDQFRCPRIDSLSRRVVAELVTLVDDYAGHGKRWTMDAVARDWSGYCKAVEDLVVRLRRRSAWENGTLYPAIRAATTGAPAS